MTQNCLYIRGWKMDEQRLLMDNFTLNRPK